MGCFGAMMIFRNMLKTAADVGIVGENIVYETTRMLSWWKPGSENAVVDSKSCATNYVGRWVMVVVLHNIPFPQGFLDKNKLTFYTRDKRLCGNNAGVGLADAYASCGSGSTCFQIF
jgi:hypothetical protein